jgi:ABC-2 type transport system ATP-binding protein
MTVHAIEAEELVKVFGRSVRALDAVSLQVPAGTVLGLLGPNGAGKTTAVNVLTTLLRPDSGRATVDGVDVIRHPDEVRRRIGLAGQYAAVDDMLTGLENLTLIGRLNHVAGRSAATRAAELLDQFGLTEASGRAAKTYSGGMRRRLDLAAALVCRPPVLFLDEPTTGLDPRSRIDLWAVISELVADGTTLLLTTQYMEEADRLADSIAVVDRGRVIARGTPRELKARLGGSVVEIEVADASRAADAADAAARASGRAPTVDGTLVTVPANSTETLTHVVRALDSAGIAAHSLQFREPSLDDVFLALTGRATDQDPSGPNREAPAHPAAATVTTTGGEA